MSAETEEYLTVDQLAARLGWSPKTIRNKMAPGGIFKRGVHYAEAVGLPVILKWSAVLELYDWTPAVQFFFSETKQARQVSRFRLWNSRSENPTVAPEKRPAYLPQGKRYGVDPYLGYPSNRTLPSSLTVGSKTLCVSPESFV